jgi:hypothetical protein
MFMSSVRWYGAMAKSRMHQAAVEGLQEGAEYLGEKSQDVVPVSPNAGGGYLRDSLKIAVDGSQLIAAVGYDTGPTHNRGRAGGGNLAVVVHENMSTHHGGGKSAKFLETPLNANKPAIIRIIGQRMRKVM